jgi:hypothetical protein
MFSLLLSTFRKLSMISAACGSFLAICVLSASAEEIKSGPLQRFIIELIESFDNSGKIDTLLLECINIVEPAEGAGLQQCRHQETGIGFLLVTDPGEDNISVSIVYSGGGNSDQSGLSANGDPLVGAPADLERWGAELASARKQFQEAGQPECIVEESGTNRDQTGKLIFGIQNSRAESRILFLFSTVDAKSATDFDWTALRDGDILATVLVVNQLEVPCVTPK